MHGVETLFKLEIFLSPSRLQSTRDTLQLLDLLGEVGGFEGIIVAIGMYFASPLANMLMSVAMMEVFSPARKVKFTSFELYKGAYLPRSCLKSKKYDKLDDAGQEIEEILEMRNLCTALVNS